MEIKGKYNTITVFHDNVEYDEMDQMKRIANCRAFADAHSAQDAQDRASWCSSSFGQVWHKEARCDRYGGPCRHCACRRRRRGRHPRHSRHARNRSPCGSCRGADAGECGAIALQGRHDHGDNLPDRHQPGRELRCAVRRCLSKFFGSRRRERHDARTGFTINRINRQGN